MKKINVKELKNFSYELRKSILLSAKKSGGRGAHLGGTMSCVEILVYLYFSKIMKYFKNKPNHPLRDRFFIGKGHAHLALYHIWSKIGFLNKKKVDTYTKNGTKLSVQLDHFIPGSEYNTGSLGHVIGVGIGAALKAKIDKDKFKVFCLIGDGECESGSIWESVLSASRLKIDNLVVIVDMNKMSEMQTLDSKSDIELKNKFKSYKWNSVITNGHDFHSLNKALTKKFKNNYPTVIIANTIKGKGVSFMENKVEWHHQAPSQHQFDLALKEYNYEKN